MTTLGAIAAAVKKNYATRFSGSGYCAFGVASGLNFERTDSFSLYFFVRYTQSDVAHLMSRVGGVSSGTGWAQSVVSGDTRFRISNANTTNSLQMRTTNVFNDGMWHSIISTYDGSSSPTGVHIHVDNVDQALSIQSNTLSASTKGNFNLNAGRDVPQAAFQFLGDMAGAAVFTGVIPSSHRAVLHNGRKPPDKARVLELSGLLAFWRMGDGANYPTVPAERSSDAGTLTNLLPSAFKLFGPAYY